MKTPDALVVATAQVIGADRLLTTGRGWPDRVALGVDFEIDVLESAPR